MTDRDAGPLDFSEPGYAALMRAFAEAGYEVRGYRDAEPARADLIVRHDVDMCLERAAVLGALEADLGIRATYFVVLSSELYNVQSRQGREMLARLVEQGHTIGLHFDAAAYVVESQSALLPAIDRECDLLERIAGCEVDVVSFHRPGPGGVDALVDPFGSRVNVHEPRFYHEIAWCSDSTGEWRRGHPLSHPAFEARHAMQLITHPIWWVGDGDGGRDARLARFITERTAFLDAELARNCKAYRPARQPPGADTPPDPEHPK